MDWPGRITSLEILIRNQARALADMDARVRRAEQNMQQVAGGRAQPGGEATRLHWCQIPTGGVAAATGSWPSMTAASFTADVYRNGSKVATAATVHWRYPQGADQYKLVPCVPNGDGTYDAILDSCLEV